MQPPTNLQFEFSVRDPAQPGKQTVWRQELKRRVARAREKKDPTRRPKKDESAGAGLFEKAGEPDVFRYQMPAPIAGEKPPERIADVETRPNAAPFRYSLKGEKNSAPPPVITTLGVEPRESMLSRRLRPAQRSLPAPVAPQPVTIVEQPSVAPVPEGTPDKAILLTRAVSGIVDCLAVGLVTALFVAATCLALKIDPVDPLLRRLTFGLALFFHIFYTMYFLQLARRTPGMMWRGLCLVGEDDHSPTYALLLARAILYPFSVLTVVGLLWGLFDPKVRCLHDLFSATRIVRISEPRP